ncbi:hypothetical protein AB0L64_36110 [Kribbella sp. NPDC051936]|uniref:hypothetical protein n=1 Tax=Kribbella sp. NPDC051936 TaxID=3154946 RepID=UPI00341E84C6
MPEADLLRDLERTRLSHLVARRIPEADAIHAPDFEPITDIDVMVDGAVAVLRYQSAIEIGVNGREPGPLNAWHLDCYRRTTAGWQIRWSQATALT